MLGGSRVHAGISRVASAGALCAAAVVLGLVAAGFGQDAPDQPSAEIAHVLDDFHDAASKADFERYFNHLADSAVFIGTDATERWTRGEFAAFVRPYFEKGQGWTYAPRDRHVDFIGKERNAAIFDELLDSAKYGECRGTGVLVKSDSGGWKIAQYALTLPIPNGVAGEVVTVIRESKRE